MWRTRGCAHLRARAQNNHRIEWATMKNDRVVAVTRPVIATVFAILVQACAAPQAVDMADNWKPVNSLGDVPKEIPLKEEAELPKYQMLPTDSTLRTLLERWAKENGGSLDWQYPSDLTLVSGLEPIKDNNLQRALNAVRRTYAAQKLRIQVLANKSLLVSRMP